MISNSGKDEHGKYSGGQAGDQTGHEWEVVKWYNRPWRCVLRHPDAAVRADLALVSTHAAHNDLIGYDQGERLTYWNALSKAKNYDPANIITACEDDCSAGVCANVKAVGYRLGIKALQDVSPWLTTWGMREALEAAGFEVLTDQKYLTSDAYLLPGDILLNDSCHTAVNLGSGALATTPSSSVMPIGQLAVDGYFGPATVRKLQQVLGTIADGYVSGQDAGNMAAINRGGLPSSAWRIGSGGSDVIRALQKHIGMAASEQDGYFGAKTCRALQAYLGTPQDGNVSGPSTMVKELQRRLNAGTF